MALPRSLLLLAALLLAVPAAAQLDPVTFEAGHVRPLALSPDGAQLFVVNTPDGQLEVFGVEPGGTLSHSASVAVGLEPVAVAARSNDEVWVVNHLSDSISVVDLSGARPRVVRTLLVGDEPRDVVFAGSGGDRAFITTAHRGQNSPNDGLDFDTPGTGRADVWVFDATSLGSSFDGDELTVLTVFSDRPRALAVDPSDPSKVYVAAFRSGNQTTVIGEGLVCDTSSNRLGNGTVQPSCTINGQSIPGGTAPPHQNHAGADRPEVGVIVKMDRPDGTPGRWAGELDRDWGGLVNFDLPDRDVFEIDADANPPIAVDGGAGCVNGSGCWAGVGTTLFNMAVHPTNGKIYVSNSDSQNHVRFEGPGVHANGEKPGGEPNTVQGNLARVRITILDGSSVTPRHLNSHLDYAVTPAPASDKAKSLSTPLGMDFSPDGNTLYLAAFGSNKIGVFSVADLDGGSFDPDADAAAYISLAHGGPSGVIATASKLYVTNRFDNSLVVLDRLAGSEQQALSLHNPEGIEVLEGRPFLYDAQVTSSNGESSCASCHIFGDMDDLAWDLGDPDGDVVPNGNPFNPVVPPIGDTLPHEFHPMKGPMTTQSLRGLENMGPQHWRGDRQGDEVAAFEAFNVAFPGLVGNDAPISASDMTKFRKFALSLRYPPNPIRELDNSLRASEGAGETLYTGPITDTISDCHGCHTLAPEDGHFGGDGQTVFDGESQHFKIPHLRNAYQKVGMFGMGDPEGLISVDGPFTHQGPQVRGFGYLHDGAIDTAARFFSASGFSLSSSEEAEMAAFMMAFPTDLAPIVGQQLTAHTGNWNAADVIARVTLLEDQAATPFVSKILGPNATECDLVANVVEAGRERGYLFDGTSYEPDDAGTPLSRAAMRGKASTPGQEVTWTCTPPGSGQRLAHDRDQDSLLDGFETDTGVFVSGSDTGTSPALADTDGDGFDDFEEILAGTNPVDPLSFPDAPPPTAVPALGPLGLAVLAGGMALLEVSGLARHRRRSAIRGDTGS